MMPLPLSSPQVDLDMPTGTTPRARGTSWLAQPTVATRSGAFSIVVSLKACSMVTGKAAEFALSAEETDSLLVDSSDEQAVTLNSVAAAATEAMMLCARTRGRSPCLVDQQ